MLATLKTVAQRQSEDNHYLGDKDLRLFREELSSMPREMPPGIRFDTLCDLAVAELNLGELELSIAHLEEARALHPRSRLPAKDLGRCLYFLAVARIRQAETRNCCRAPSAEGCLFPLSEKARHTERTGAEQAIPVLTDYLRLQGMPETRRQDARWLLNVAHMTLGSYPQGVTEGYRLPVRRDDLPARDDFPRFPNVAEERGVANFGLSGGVIADDFNGDGSVDLIISSLDGKVSLRYYQNDGTGHFTDLSAEAGFAGITGGLNINQADCDNDGDLDVLVLRGAWLREIGRQPNSLLCNLGNRNGIPWFRYVAYASGLAGVDYPVLSADWADFDLDGDLDLYLGNESTPEQVSPSQLFRNDGPGPDGIPRFTDIGAVAGVTNDRQAKGVSWGDYDGDRWPDLYVSNMGEENRLYRNRGDGTFEDVAPQLHLTGPVMSFPAWFWDCNNDGALDIMVPNYLNTGGGRFMELLTLGGKLEPEDLPALYLGDGRGGFQNRVRESGLAVPMMPMGCNFGDLDNDGYPEFYLANGSPNYADIVPNQLFHNRGGLRFDDVTIPSGTGHLQKGHGTAFADFDGDGNLDLFVELGGAVPGDPFFDALFQNPGFPGHHWLAMRLHGVKSNRFGVGCRITATVEEDGRSRVLHSLVDTGGSFGANPLSRIHLGLGGADRVKRLEIFWPVTGKTQVLEQVAADRLVEIVEDAPDSEVPPVREVPVSTGTR
ncbi:MAG: CRTAC1 family protein [Verrucomicrobiales bacterium]